MQNIYTRLINRNHPLPPDYVPENLVDIGIPYEPWHIRYVTRELSGYLTLTGMTLEEYLDFPVKTKSASGFEKWKF